MEVLKCKITGEEFNDLENRSGHVTIHLKKININIPTAFIRRQYLKNKGKYWHYQYFDIIVKDEIQKKKCKYCGWKTSDLDNKSGQYTTHLKKNHQKNIQEYVDEFPDEIILFKTFFDKKKYKEEKISSVNNYISCIICNEKLKYLTNTHLKKHNIDLTEYKLRFPEEKFLSDNFKEKTKGILILATKNIKNSYVSAPEKDLKTFLEDDLKVNIIKNDKKLLNGVEIDVLIPEHNIAIEFNGNRYHSEIYGKKNNSFHITKTELCKEKGYKLIHIFEDEWFLKNLIVKSKLKHLLHLNNSKIIHSRKCIIKKITANEKNVFLEKNHIQGYDKSDIHIGAFYDNFLISVMTFDNKRKMVIKNNLPDVYELKRFSIDINYKVPGIFSKILNYFVKNYTPKKIISFADRRWTINKENLYTKNGFILSKILKPDYTYYNSKISRYNRFHKFGFGKSSLKIKFPNIYSDSKTEWEMMKEMGYDRIWDCGKFKYELSL